MVLGAKQSFSQFSHKLVYWGEEILQYTWSLFYGCRVYAKYLNFLAYLDPPRNC